MRAHSFQQKRRTMKISIRLIMTLKTSAGIDKFYTKQGKVLHPNGLSLAVDNISKESPTQAELGLSDNWSLKFNHKNVKMGLIKTNG